MSSYNRQSKIPNLKSKIGSGSAPGKVILCGEHAVVYGQPALAVPVNGVQARVTVQTSEQPGLTVHSLNLDRLPVDEQGRINERLHAVAARVADLIGILCVSDQQPEPNGGLLITLDSNIPIERGLGSGAAIGVAMIRAFAAYFALDLSDAQVSAMAYETEKLHHGTPSGIDNTVVAYNQPVYFVREQPIELLQVRSPLHLLIADSGTRGSTADIVAGVRQRREADPSRYDALFDQIGAVARMAKGAIEVGDISNLGLLFNHNQQLLEQIGVSSPALQRLCAATVGAGAWGAKLSGAGQGGNMIALVTPPTEAAVGEALRAAGAVNVIATTVAPTKGGHS